MSKVDFRVHTDAKNGDYRWLTVQHPAQAGFQLGLFRPQAPQLDAQTARGLAEAVAKGAVPFLVLMVENVRAHHETMAAAGVEFTQAPVERYGAVDASFRDPSATAGNSSRPARAVSQLSESSGIPKSAAG